MKTAIITPNQELTEIVRKFGKEDSLHFIHQARVSYNDAVQHTEWKNRDMPKLIWQDYSESTAYYDFEYGDISINVDVVPEDLIKYTEKHEVIELYTVIEQLDGREISIGLVEKTNSQIHLDCIKNIAHKYARVHEYLLAKKDGKLGLHHEFIESSLGQIIEEAAYPEIANLFYSQLNEAKSVYNIINSGDGRSLLLSFEEVTRNIKSDINMSRN